MRRPLPANRGRHGTTPTELRLREKPPVFRVGAPGIGGNGTVGPSFDMWFRSRAGKLVARVCRGLGLVGLAASSCYNPKLSDCTMTCGDKAACPSGQHCNNGYCSASRACAPGASGASTGGTDTSNVGASNAGNASLGGTPGGPSSVAGSGGAVAGGASGADAGGTGQTAGGSDGGAVACGASGSDSSGSPDALRQPFTQPGAFKSTPGVGGFTLLSTFELSAFPSDIVLYFANVTGDAATDLLIFDPTTHSLQVFPAANGGFESTPSDSLTLAPDMFAPLQLVDVDGQADGYADVVQLLRNGDHICYLRAGSGTQFQAAQRSAGHGDPSESVFGDFDGDGKVDSAQVHVQSQVSSAFFWQGTTTGFQRIGAWDQAFPAPQTGNAYVPHAQRAAHFVAGEPPNLAGAAQILLPAVGSGAVSNEVTLLSAHSSVASRVWLTGFGSVPELAIADVDNDGFVDALQLANSGALAVWRGGTSPALYVRANEERYTGAAPTHSLFMDVDNTGNRDLVRLPHGAGDIDVWLGTNAPGADGGTVPYIEAGGSWGTLGYDATQYAPIQAKTCDAEAPGPEELAVYMKDLHKLIVLSSTKTRPPAPPASATVEATIRDGFERYLSNAPDNVALEAYDTEAALIELSAWRFIGGDAVLKQAILDFELSARYAGDNDWLGTDTFGNSSPDIQARQTINFLLGYRVLGLPRLLTYAETSLDALILHFGRRPHASGPCQTPLASCYSYVDEGAPNDNTLADPSQNLEVALAFALLRAEPTSKFSGLDAYMAPGSQDSLSIQDVISSEVEIAFSMQDAGVVSAFPFNGGLLLNEDPAYQAQGVVASVTELDDLAAGTKTGGYDTRAGAFALTSALWLDQTLSLDPWYANGLGASLRADSRLERAASWLNDWSRTGDVPNAPVGLYCKAGGHSNCLLYAPNTVDEWDAWYRVASLWYLNAQGASSGTCPDQLLRANLNGQRGFQPLETLLLLGVPRAFFSQGC